MIRKAALLLFLLCLSAGPARAQWTRLAASPDETDIRSVTSDPKDAQVLYAASSRRLYRSGDAGGAWKPVFSARGDNRLLALYVDPAGTIWVGGDQGLRRSTDGGKRWAEAYRRSGKSGIVRAVAPAAEGALWLGTEDGLVLWKGMDADEEVASLPKSPVLAIAAEKESLLVTAESGVYESADAGKSWKQVFFARAEEEDALAQFEIEELPTAGGFAAGLALLPDGPLYAATPKGLLEKHADSWAPIGADATAGKSVNALAASRKALYAATERGVYRWDPSARSLSDVSDGLASPDARALVYDARQDALFAATPSGIYRLDHPELHFIPSSGGPRPTVDGILLPFASEPSIREVQDAAIRYAEVSPEKIERWRRAAARKAWFPTVSVGTDLHDDENIDLDRGGTNDPDRFIVGPNERTADFSVDFSWDLGEIVWNGDQTSIDTRSKLMVELRDDILSEVTHLYYERRRLQAEIAMTPSPGLPAEIDKRIKLEELTARLDALTGGFYSDAAREGR